MNALARSERWSPWNGRIVRSSPPARKCFRSMPGARTRGLPTSDPRRRRCSPLARDRRGARRDGAYSPFDDRLAAKLGGTMPTAKELLDQGRLGAAIEAITADVK